MSTQLETERKYEGAALPERLDRVRGVADQRGTGPKELDAIYYDTPDLRLLRHRITLRRRTGGSDAGWHLKLPRSDDAREEVRLPLSAGAPDAVPAELAQLVKAHTRGATVRPVARLRTRRTGLLLHDDRGDTLAEVTADRVTAELLDGGRTGPETEPTRWTEFEVELDHGKPALLDRIEAVLTDSGLVRSRWPSKLARALGEPRADGARPTSTTTPADTAAAGSAGALVMDEFRSLLATLLTLDAAVRRDEEDAVHQMRVTARRLRSQLKAHRRIFRGDTAEALADDLRWLGRLLGPARDQEVLGELLTGETEALPSRLRRRELCRSLAEHYSRGYQQGRQRAVAAFDGDRYLTLLERLDSFAADPPLRSRADRKARKYLAGVLRREQRRTVRRLDHALATDPGPERDEALHRARKAAKRARYTAEHAEPHLPRRTAKRVAKYGSRMKKLHKVLGTYQDSVVARRELIHLERDGSAGRRYGFAYGVLHERQRTIARAAQERVPELRRRAGRAKLSRLS